MMKRNKVLAAAGTLGLGLLIATLAPVSASATLEETPTASYSATCEGGWEIEVVNYPTDTVLYLEVDGVQMHTGTFGGAYSNSGTFGDGTHSMTVVVDTVSGNYEIDDYIETGDCTPPPPPPTDVCDNIDGDQATIPDGYVADGEDCVLPPPPPPTDVCDNIDGDQATIPDGYVADGEDCVLPPPPPPTPPTTVPGGGTDGGDIVSAVEASSQQEPAKGVNLGLGALFGALLFGAIAWATLQFNLLGRLIAKLRPQNATVR